MTTRDGQKWLIIHGLGPPFVARRDSPAAKEARRNGALTVKFRTLRGACRVLRLSRDPDLR